jgi:hypothetical protein
VFALWWQLETFLREVVEFEMAAKEGGAWLHAGPRDARKWMSKDEINHYMKSGDAGS